MEYHAQAEYGHAEDGTDWRRKPSYSAVGFGMENIGISRVSANYSLTLRGWDDLVRGLANWRIWHLMGIGTIRRRYSRSRIGQFWTTISMGIMITVMGLVWSALWKMPLNEIFPFIATGLVLWTFLTGTINDACNALIGSSHYFLNQGMSFSTPIYAAIYSQLIILLHNMIIVVLILIIFPQPLSLEMFLVIPGFVLTLITLVWVSCIIATLCARYRDLIQLISSILTTALYVTPIMFKPDFIPSRYQWINTVNPFAVFISIMRDPLVGREIPWENWAVALAIAVIGTIIMVPFIGRVGKRVIFWI
jgi:lipopolysaccharide transport system permease protein